MTQWIRFEHAVTEGFGVLEGTRIAVHQGDMYQEPRATPVVLELAEVRVLAPTRPGKFLGLWNNYRALAAKLGLDAPTEPLCFIKSSNSYLDPEGLFRRPRSYQGAVVYEGELGIVIGSRCSDVDETRAEDAIFGYTCINDITATDLLTRDPSFFQWTRAKSCDGFGPIGPVIATGLDWQQLRVRTVLNGVERQNYPVADMILPPARIVCQMSQEMTLMPGDVIACGTSLGVRPMRPGSTVEIEIEGIGTLRNVFAQDSAP